MAQITVAEWVADHPEEALDLVRSQADRLLPAYAEFRDNANAGLAKLWAERPEDFDRTLLGVIRRGENGPEPLPQDPDVLDVHSHRDTLTAIVGLPGSGYDFLRPKRRFEIDVDALAELLGDDALTYE